MPVKNLLKNPFIFGAGIGILVVLLNISIATLAEGSFYFICPVVSHKIPPLVFGKHGRIIRMENWHCTAARRLDNIL